MICSVQDVRGCAIVRYQYNGLPSGRGWEPSLLHTSAVVARWALILCWPNSPTMAASQGTAAVKHRQLKGQYDADRQGIWDRRHPYISSYLHQCSWREDHGEAE